MSNPSNTPKVTPEVPVYFRYDRAGGVGGEGYLAPGFFISFILRAYRLYSRIVAQSFVMTMTETQVWE